jgi:cell division septation protein DedD
MPASADTESEILLGNKQLLLVFVVVVVLLAIAFFAGFKLGKNSAEKTGAAVAESAQTSVPAADSSGGPITQKIAPDDSQAPKAETAPVETPAPVVSKEERVLGSRPTAEAPRATAGLPHPGENYVQVTAVARKVADATADVLRQHGFSARVAPAPGNAAIFRVLVGPAKDPADLRNTEDKLRKIGYTKCFVQHY